MNLLQKHKQGLLLAIILLGAAFLRLYRISDYLTFLGDEGRDVLVVYNILHGHLTLLGPTASVGGFFLGPIYYYLIAPFLLFFNYDPTGPAVMVALFGVVTVWFVYKVGAEFFNKTAGILAASLYAISPLVVAYSRSSWNPNLMPIATLFTLYLLYKAVLKDKKLLFILSGLSFGITMQFHYIAVFAGVIMAVYVAWNNFFLQRVLAVKKTIVQFVSLAIGFVIGWSPFLVFEARHDFLNIKNIIGFIFNPQGKDAISTHAGFIPIVWDVFFRLFGRLITDYPPPEQVSAAAHLNIFVWFLVTAILAIGSFWLFFIQFKRTENEKKKLQFGLLFIWLVLGVGLFGFYRKNIYDYYFGFLFPLPFFLVGNFLFFLWSRKHILRVISGFSFAILLVVNVQAIPFRYSANRQLEQTKNIARFVLSKTNGKSFNFALISAGNSDHAYRYFFKIWRREPTGIEHDNGKGKNVTDQLLVICEDPVCQPLGNASWEIAGFGRAEITDVWNVSVVKVYKLTHYRGT